MQVIRIEDVPVKKRVHNHRMGTFVSQDILIGEDGTPGNFILQLVDTTTDFFSPRHRHNFDQFRYQVEGEFDFDRNGRLKPGMLGYFPEATPYGPQTSAERALTLVLQFGGASGNGYMSKVEMEKATEQLKRTGRFEDGIYYRDEGTEGKKKMDGYQAVWEYVNKRPMVYPKSRYHDPMIIKTANFDWVPMEGAAGVYDRMYGVFTERRTEGSGLKLEAGAKYGLHGRRLHFVVNGEGTVAGKPYGRHTTIFCETGENAAVAANTETEILILGLPTFEQRAHRSIAAE